MINKELVLEGLTCGGCALKIEQETLDLGVPHARINIALGKMYLTLEESMDFEGLYNSIVAIVKNHEPDVLVHQGEIAGDNTSKHELWDRVSTIIGTVLFILGFVLKDYYSIGAFGIAYVLIGREVLLTSFKNVLKGKVFDENFLMSIATIGAILIGEWEEAVGVMLFFKIGEYIQDRAVNSSKRSIKALLSQKPDFANLVVGERVVSVNPESVKVNDEVMVRPGERIPVDGLIIRGSSYIDQSSITGESIPIVGTLGSEVLGGSVNGENTIWLKATKEYRDSAIARIMRLVEEASARKAPAERFLTRFARYYTPGVVALAMITAFVPTILGGDIRVWGYRALVFLVVSCPCALLISVPLGYFGGIGAASKKGILVKGGAYLDILAKVKAVVFDKTGTLTEGKFGVKGVYPSTNSNGQELLYYTALAESQSSHPIARSILEHFKATGDILKVEHTSGETKIVLGEGVEYKVADMIVRSGKASYIGIEDEDSYYGSKVYTSLNGVVLGSIHLEDSIKTDVIELIKDIKRTIGDRVYMLSGDRESVALDVSTRLGLTKGYGGLMPSDKVARLESLKGEASPIVYVGDGVNDAPVMKSASVSVSMGALGSDAAIEVSDVVIVDDNPHKLMDVINISKATRRIIIQNITMSLGIKFLVMGMSLFGLAGMWEAVFADVGVALMAILNSTRLLHFKG